MKLATEEITTMKVLEGQATPAPWTAWKGNNAVYYGLASFNEPARYASAGPDSFAVCQTDDMRMDEMEELEPGTPEDDAAFIAAARNFVPRAIEHIRFTEASTEEALLILDAALARDFEGDLLKNAIDMAVQKLRPVLAPVHDTEALAQLAEKYPIELPWMSADSINGVRSSEGYSPLGPPTECQQTNCAMCRKPEPGVAQGLTVEQPAVDVVLSKRALRALTFGQRVELSDTVGVHFALVEAVLQQPKATQGTFTAAKFAELMEAAAQRYDVVAEILKGGGAE